MDDNGCSTIFCDLACYTCRYASGLHTIEAHPLKSGKQVHLEEQLGFLLVRPQETLFKQSDRDLRFNKSKARNALK